MQKHGRTDIGLGKEIKENQERERGKKDNVLLY